MEEKTTAALRWIVGIFSRHNVPYRMGGGFAAKMYGSTRPLNDLDFGIPEKYFPVILPEVSPYLTFGPTHWNGDGKWDCTIMSLDYYGQEIDISASDTIKMSNKERTEWIPLADAALHTVTMDLDGIAVQLMNPRALRDYKKELDGDHQLIDIEALDKYIAEHGL